MARRKATAAEAVQPPASDPVEGELPPPDTAPQSEPPARRWSGPATRKTVNLDGLKLTLQESRPEGQPWQMQIKFGDGSLEQKPGDAVLDYLKSHRKTVTTRDGETKDVRLFQWNNDEKAWAMRIDFDAPATSRQKAEQLFAEVVKLVARERGVSPGR